PTLNSNKKEASRLYTEVEVDGPSLIYEYEITNGLFLGGKLQWQPRDFRLDEDAFVPSAVLQDDRFTIAALLNWRPNRNVRLGVEAGASLWQEFTVLDEDGDELFDQESDPTPYVGVSFNVRF
ncbi:MAG: hypothetical protein VYC34_00100, partial [Planctomycetota bacterium]|nr:hypothetical protein [Planctomycetota bacterium]